MEYRAVLFIWEFFIQIEMPYLSLPWTKRKVILAKMSYFSVKMICHFITWSSTHLLPSRLPIPDFPSDRTRCRLHCWRLNSLLLRRLRHRDRTRWADQVEPLTFLFVHFFKTNKAHQFFTTIYFPHLPFPRPNWTKSSLWEWSCYFSLVSEVAKEGEVEVRGSKNLHRCFLMVPQSPCFLMHG